MTPQLRRRGVHRDDPLPIVIPPHHYTYTYGDHVADTTYLPSCTDPLQEQAVHGLHMSEMSGYDDDGRIMKGLNDVDTTLMAQNIP